MSNLESLLQNCEFRQEMLNLRDRLNQLYTSSQSYHIIKQERINTKNRMISNYGFIPTEDYWILYDLAVLQ